MKYSIKVKSTGDITQKEWADLIAGFNYTFSKNYDQQYLEKKYYLSSLSHSFHSFLYCDENIAGMISAIPRKYSYFGKEKQVALLCDAFILKQHRKDEAFLREMAGSLFLKLGEADITFSVSLPNNLAYSYWKYFGLWKSLGTMSYYAIPLRPGRISGKTELLDNLIYFTFKAISSIFSGFYRKKADPKNISLIKDDSYFSDRYFDDYKIRERSGTIRYVYKIYDEDGIRTAYLIDCVPFTKSNIARALKEIIRESGPVTDLILFIGTCQNPFYFLKVPSGREPRKQRVLGYCTDEKEADEFYRYSNWDLSLANFDNR